jgi:hypothetical protein
MNGRATEVFPAHCAVDARSAATGMPVLVFFYREDSGGVSMRLPVGTGPVRFSGEQFGVLCARVDELRARVCAEEHPDLCVDDDELFDADTQPLSEVFTRADLDSDDAAAYQASRELQSLYDRITRLWSELEAVERALRVSEPDSARARQARAWVREALGGLEYPVFRGLDEAEAIMRSAPTARSPLPQAAAKNYVFRLPSTLRHGTTPVSTSTGTEARPAAPTVQGTSAADDAVDGGSAG